jgi:acyl carrier protein
MTLLHLDDLQAIAREVIGDPDIVLTGEMSAMDVPGWDSLHHTLISIEIGGWVGRDIEAQDLAKAPTFRDLLDFVNRPA